MTGYPAAERDPTVAGFAAERVYDDAFRARLLDRTGRRQVDPRLLRPRPVRPRPAPDGDLAVTIHAGGGVGRGVRAGTRPNAAHRPATDRRRARTDPHGLEPGVFEPG